MCSLHFCSAVIANPFESGEIGTKFPETKQVISEEQICYICTTFSSYFITLSENKKSVAASVPPFDVYLLSTARL